MKFKELTSEQIEYLKTLDGIMRKDATSLFNERYNCDVCISTMKSWLQRLGVKSSGTGRFDGTQKPWAKGLSKEEFWSRYSQEAKERMINAPKEANKTAKIGDVHIKCGVPYIITSLDYSKPFDKRREPLRRVVWEKHNGEIPNDCMIIHLNGNQLDCRIENLALIPKRYRADVLRYMKSENADITKCAIAYCELKDTIKGAKTNDRPYKQSRCDSDYRFGNE